MVRQTKKNVSDNVASRNMPFYFLSFICALFLAWIINKDVSIPSWLILPVGFFGAFFLFFKSIDRSEIPFYALVAYLPFNSILSGTFGGMMSAVNLTNILILIAVFGWFSNNLSHRKKVFEGNGLNWLVFLFCLLGVLSVVRGGFYYGSRYAMEFIVPLKRWLTPLFLYFIALNMVRTKEIMKNTVVIMMIVVAVAGLLAIKEGIDIGGGSLDSSRVKGLADQPNMTAAFFVYYMFLYLGFYLLNWKRAAYWSLLIPFLICFRGIQVTFSRGGYMAFAFGLAGITFFKNKALFIALCLFTGFAVLNPQFLPGGVRYAIDRTAVGEAIYDNTPLEETIDRSAASRIEIWKGAWQIIQQNPWWGIGYGIFPHMIPYYVSGVGQMDAHNTYIIIAAEMGIPVLLVFLLIIFVVFKNALWVYKKIEDKFIKAVALGFLGGLFGMLMANMFGSRLDSESVSAYFWILSGLIVRAVLMKKRKEVV